VITAHKTQEVEAGGVVLCLECLEGSDRHEVAGGGTAAGAEAVAAEQTSDALNQWPMATVKHHQRDE
jgi:hypothetical protein